MADGILAAEPTYGTLGAEPPTVGAIGEPAACGGGGVLEAKPPTLVHSPPTDPAKQMNNHIRY